MMPASTSVALARLRSLVLDKVTSIVEFPTFGPDCAPNLASIVVLGGAARGQPTMNVLQLAHWRAGALRTFVLQGVALTCERHPLDATVDAGDDDADAALAEAVAAWTEAGAAARVAADAVYAACNARIVTQNASILIGQRPWTENEDEASVAEEKRAVPAAADEAVAAAEVRRNQVAEAREAAKGRVHLAAAAIAARDIGQAMPVFEKMVHTGPVEEPAKVVMDAVAAAVAARGRDDTRRG